MVSAALSDALFDPSGSLEQLFSTYSGNKDDFPGVVTKHFATIFERDDAFLQIPPLSLDNPPESYQPRSLVRFRGMVQDTLQPEIYAYNVSGTTEGTSKLGGWGSADTLEYHDDGVATDYTNLKERAPYWVVSVPGESEWVDQTLRGEDHPSQRDKFSHQPQRPHKFPTPNSPHIGVNTKIYDTSLPAFKPTEVITFIGILSSESLNQETFESTEDCDVRVPVLHVLFVRPALWPTLQLNPLPKSHISASQPSSLETRSMSKDELLALRSELVGWIADEALCGDQDAAEWVLITSASRVHSRNPAILPTSLMISSFPAPNTEATIQSPPALQIIISLLFPLTVAMALPSGLSPVARPGTKDLSLPKPPKGVSRLHFAPHSELEDLHSGILQLPAGTVLAISEANIKEGPLPPGAAENLDTLRTVLNSQKLQYRFPFSSGSGFEFPTDISAIVLCEGSRSLFLPDTDVVIPLRPSIRDEPLDSALFKNSSKIQLPRPEKLAAYRALVCQAKTSSVKISQEVAKYIQSDFVTDRQQGKHSHELVSPDDLILRMKLCRPLAATFCETEVTPEIWHKLKDLDRARKARITSSSQ